MILLYNYIINQKTNQANLQNHLKWHYDVRLYYRLRLCFIQGQRWKIGYAKVSSATNFVNGTNLAILASSREPPLIRGSLQHPVHNTKRTYPLVCPFCCGQRYSLAPWQESRRAVEHTQEPFYPPCGRSSREPPLIRGSLQHPVHNTKRTHPLVCPFCGGQRWIRTTEVEDVRFTV